MTDELRPCPWCNGTDLRVSTYDVQPDDYHGGYVTCIDCDAQGAAAGYKDGWLSTKAEAHAAAITAWNTRPSPNAERVAELEAALEPFANFGADNTASDLLASGPCGIWSVGGCEGERIKDWFGPTDFYKAHLAARPEGEG